jgi:hypothetical protein
VGSFVDVLLACALLQDKASLYDYCSGYSWVAVYSAYTSVTLITCRR